MCHINGGVSFVSNATGSRKLIVLLNGTTTIGSSSTAPGSGAVTSEATVSIDWMLIDGDYVEFQAYQSSGGSLNTVPGTGVTYGNVVCR